MNVHVHVTYYYDTGEANVVESGLILVTSLMRLTYGENYTSSYFLLLIKKK